MPNSWKTRDKIMLVEAVNYASFRRLPFRIFCVKCSTLVSYCNFLWQSANSLATSMHRDESFNLKIGFYESILFDSNMGRVNFILKLRGNAHAHSISRSPKKLTRNALWWFAFSVKMDAMSASGWSGWQSRCCTTFRSFCLGLSKANWPRAGGRHELVECTVGVGGKR